MDTVYWISWGVLIIVGVARVLKIRKEKDDVLEW